jgi:threonyl-tRNA synthetase
MKQQDVPMISITLPDGTSRDYKSGVTGIEIAESIGAGLAKASAAIYINNVLSDLRVPITEDANVSIVTSKSDEGLEVIRHDTAHILAQAVQELYSDTQITIGPVIDDGFYYDFARSKPFTPEDLEKIEAKMQEIVKENYEITRTVMPRDEAVEFFKKQGEKYKAEIIESIPTNEDITLYQQGDFIDLCRGPHAMRTGFPKAFKLMKVAGAYWRGDANNEMLQRVYGTAWATEKELKAYLHRLEEAEKRDHRKLGKEMDLFHFQDEAPGMIFWHPKGWKLYKALKQFLHNRCEKAGYQEVSTPQLLDSTFWEKSGHWGKFRENMFTSVIEEKVHALKPMNCPGKVQIFRQQTRSYRDLPMRYIEYNYLHRNEPSGALHGMLRLRAFTQDDGHIFCRPDQINSETKLFCDLLQGIYKDLGFESFRIKLADRPEKRAGTDEVWDKAEAALKEAVAAAGLEYDLAPGEGAFYGPKLEFHLLDALGRTWQCGTIQVDFVLPERLDANYVGADGQKHRPVLLHRAILGSFERFIGILIEQYAGKFPLWLAPVQVVVATITNEVNDYAETITQQLQDLGVKVELDSRSDKIGYKIREHSLSKVPVIVAVGQQEKEKQTVSVRRLGSKNQETLALSEFVNKIQEESALPS